MTITFALLFSAMVPSLAQTPEKDAAEVRAYVLTMENVLRTYKTMYEIRQAAAKDPNPGKQINADTSDDKAKNSLTALTTRYSAYPAIVSVIANNGFTPRLFITSELALVQAGLAAAAVNAGAPRASLVAQGGVSGANLDFVVQHQSELDELGRKYPAQ